MPRTVAWALQETAQKLATLSQTPSLDAQVLLAHILRRTRSWVVAHPETPLTDEQADSLADCMARLLAGEPLPYVLGHWEFYGMDFILTPEVLIPRPETELLVEKALAWLDLHPKRRFALDVGTGSGCIAVVLAARQPDLRVVASDLSYPAISVARLNAHRHDVAGRVFCLQGDLFPPVASRFDLICANLPYIPSHRLRSLPVYRREPSLALDGGADGLALIRRLLEQAPDALASDGLLLFEIEASQGQAALALARSAFPCADVNLHPDLAGLDRLISIQT